MEGRTRRSAGGTMRPVRRCCGSALRSCHSSCAVFGLAKLAECRVSSRLPTDCGSKRTDGALNDWSFTQESRSTLSLRPTITSAASTSCSCCGPARSSSRRRRTGTRSPTRTRCRPRLRRCVVVDLPHVLGRRLRFGRDVCVTTTVDSGRRLAVGAL